MREVSWGKIAAVAGVLFVVLFVAGVLMTFDSPAPDADDAEQVEWWSDSGNQTQAIFGGYLLTLAGLAFLPFSTGIRSHLRALPGSEPLGTVAFAASLVFVAMVMAAALAFGQVAGAVKFGSTPLPDADFLRMFPQFGSGLLLLAGGLSASFAIAATSWAVLRTGAFERWLGWLGFVCAAILLLAVFFIPMVALLVWVVAASVLLWRRPLPA